MLTSGAGLGGAGPAPETRGEYFLARRLTSDHAKPIAMFGLLQRWFTGGLLAGALKF